MKPLNPNVIEKEQRISASGNNIINTHRNQIFTRLGFHPVFEKNLQFGSNPITSRHNDRISIIT